jgi:bifunctional non-homologous end joining protein LigD
MGKRFVVHEHHASRLHFDFRLELEGVLKSWAVPKGPSMNPAEKRLAVKVEDHALEYVDFEGVIAEGNYGAGAVVIWDEGEFELLETSEKKISFLLHGRILQGGFTLSKLKPRGKGPANDWLLIKKNDQHANREWQLELALTDKKRKQLEEGTPPCQTS